MLKLKAKFESGLSHFSFKRWNQTRSTRGQPGVNLGSTCTTLPREEEEVDSGAGAEATRAEEEVDAGAEA
jgi:hypothetical protein